MATASGDTGKGGGHKSRCGGVAGGGTTGVPGPVTASVMMAPTTMTRAATRAV